MSNAAGQSSLAPCDQDVTEAAMVERGVAERRDAVKLAKTMDVVVEQLLQAFDDEDGDAQEVKKEVKKRERKERHRESMARGRSRHNQFMENMRKQYSNLSTKLESGVEVWKRLRGGALRRDGSQGYASAGSDDDCGYTSGSSCSTVAEMTSVAHSELYARYVAAVETENAIHRENEALTRRLEQLAIFEAKLRVDTPGVDHAGMPSQREEESKTPSSRPGPLNRPGYWSYFAQDTKPFYYVPMTRTQCDLLIRNMYQSSQSHHLRFVTQLRRQHPRDRMQFFGWTVQRSVTDGTQFHFHFTKVFPCSDSSALAEDMADEGWRIFNTPERYKKLYRTAMDVRVLQRVDRFNTVIMRNSPDASGTHRTRHLTLMTKISNVDARGQKSLAILTLVIQPPEDAANSGKSDVRFIRDAYTYLRFDMCMGGVKFTYGGHGDCLHPALAKYLFVETGNVLLRFEQMVFPSNLVTFS